MALTPNTFNPDHVMLRDTLGQNVGTDFMTDRFMEALLPQSALMRLGTQVDMSGGYYHSGSGIASELSDAYFVGEGHKIGSAKLEAKDWEMRAVKIGVILPVTDEFLHYTWSRYFEDVVPAVADKFYKKIDGSAFLGLNGDPFGSNVLASATASSNVIEGDLTADNIYAIEDAVASEGTAFISNRNSERSLRGLIDPVSQMGIFDRPDRVTRVGTLDSYPYVRLELGSDNAEMPDGTLIYGDFKKLFYGIPRGAQLRMKLADQATLSLTKNADGTDINLFEQDMYAMRFVFEIGVAVPEMYQDSFAVLQAPEVP